MTLFHSSNIRKLLDTLDFIFLNPIAYIKAILLCVIFLAQCICINVLALHLIALSLSSTLICICYSPFDLKFITKYHTQFMLYRYTNNKRIHCNVSKRPLCPFTVICSDPLQHFQVSISSCQSAASNVKIISVNDKKRSPNKMEWPNGTDNNNTIVKIDIYDLKKQSVRTRKKKILLPSSPI